MQGGPFGLLSVMGVILHAGKARDCIFYPPNGAGCAATLPSTRGYCRPANLRIAASREESSFWSAVAAVEIALASPDLSAVRKESWAAASFLSSGAPSSRKATTRPASW